jgi:iron complex transport system permease protein
MRRSAPRPDPATRPTFRVSRHARTVILLLGIAVVLALLLDITFGESGVQELAPPNEVARVLASHLPFVGPKFVRHDDLSAARNSIIWLLRLPRALSAVLIGMMLALAGAAFQSLLQNPLADPYTAGVASGSALSSVAITLLGGAGWLMGLAQPAAAFAGGLLTVWLVYLVSRTHGRISTQTFLLAGTIVGTFFWSLVPLIITLASRGGDNQRDRILSTLFGNLEGVSWDRVALLLPFALVGGLILWWDRDDLDVMTLGEESAIHQGVDAQRFTRRVIVAGALMTAAAVSVAGIIAFVGFVAPHLARTLLRSAAHRVLLPATLLLGGLLLLVADLLARVVLNGIEIGVVTSLIGAPLFCGLLRRRLLAA